MSEPFVPPGISSLTAIDVAETSYQEESVVVQGIVSSSGVRGWPGQSDDYEVQCVGFVAWRRVDGMIVRNGLTTLRAVPPDSEWGDFPEYSVRRLRVRLSTDETRAVVEAILPVDRRDAELEALSQELQRPVVESTERFGDVVLNRRYGWFEVQSTWRGGAIRVTLGAEDDEIAPAAMAMAEALWSNETEWAERIEAFVTEELLDEVWLEEGEAELSAKKFLARIKLTSIGIDSEGGFEFWFDDGDLFWGHSIMVSGNPEEGPTDAGIHG